MTNENEQFLKNNIIKNANIKEEPKEIKSPNWIHKNKFYILAIIDSNKFNYKNKIGKFKYDNMKDLVNNIRNITISEISAKKDLNTLNEIKNAEIVKYKKRTPWHKELLNLFDDLLDVILTDKTLKSESQEDKNENESVYGENENKNENENENENEDNESEDEDEDEIIKILMSWYEDYDDDEINNRIKKSNDHLDEIIDKSKSFEDQIKSIKK